jgi:hypothetical protein
MYKVLVSSTVKKHLRIIERIGGTFDIVIGVIAIATLIHIFYETAIAVLPMSIWSVGILLMVVLISLTIVIYETVKQYRVKIKEVNQ